MGTFRESEIYLLIKTLLVIGVIKLFPRLCDSSLSVHAKNLPEKLKWVKMIVYSNKAICNIRTRGMLGAMKANITPQIIEAANQSIQNHVSRHPLPTGMTDSDLENAVYEALDSVKVFPGNSRHLKSLLKKIVQHRATDLARKAGAKKRPQFISMTCEADGEQGEKTIESSPIVEPSITARNEEAQAARCDRIERLRSHLESTKMGKELNVLAAAMEQALDGEALTQRAIAKRLGVDQTVICRTFKKFKKIDATLRKNPPASKPAPSM